MIVYGGYKTYGTDQIKGYGRNETGFKLLTIISLSYY
jgi:hypothetical protein